jgi:hypothetical protein
MSPVTLLLLVLVLLVASGAGGYSFGGPLYGGSAVVVGRRIDLSCHSAGVGPRRHRTTPSSTRISTTTEGGTSHKPG